MGEIDIRLAEISREAARGGAAAPLDSTYQSADVAKFEIRLCGCCGQAINNPGAAIKRGAIVLLQDPLRILWNRQLVLLSPTESVMFALVARKGRATFAELDRAIAASGGKPANRSVLILRIRKKFKAMGARDPLERVGSSIRIVAEPDEDNSSDLIIGLPQTRYADIC